MEASGRRVELTSQIPMFAASTGRFRYAIEKLLAFELCAGKTDGSVRVYCVYLHRGRNIHVLLFSFHFSVFHLSFPFSIFRVAENRTTFRLKHHMSLDVWNKAGPV